ncbi:MAG: response regulator [bacterium]
MNNSMCPFFEICLSDIIPGVAKFRAALTPQRKINWLSDGAKRFLKISSLGTLENLQQVIKPTYREQVLKQIEQWLKTKQERYEIEYAAVVEGQEIKIKEIGILIGKKENPEIYGVLINLSIKDKITEYVKNEVISETTNKILDIYRNDINNCISGVVNTLAILKQRIEVLGEAYEENPTWRDLKKIDGLLDNIHDEVDFVFSFYKKVKIRRPVEISRIFNLASSIAAKMFKIKMDIYFEKPIHDQPVYCEISPENFILIFILLCQEFVSNSENKVVSIHIAPHEYQGCLIVLIKLDTFKTDLFKQSGDEFENFITHPVESILRESLNEIGGTLNFKWKDENVLEEAMIKIPLIQEKKENLLDTIAKGKGQTILLVDDDEIVRQTTSKMLENLGYNVFRASGGIEAKKIFQENMEIIELAIIDLIMPEIDGLGVAEQIKEINPDIKIIFLSGYHYDRRINDSPYMVISKPFNLTSLARAVEKTLESKLSFS